MKENKGVKNSLSKKQTIKVIKWAELCINDKIFKYNAAKKRNLRQSKK